MESDARPGRGRPRVWPEYAPSGLRATIRLDRMAAVLPVVAGRTIERIFLAEYSGTRFRMMFVFTDGTSYEFYGVGDINGASAVESAGAAVVRARLAMDHPLQVHEVAAVTPTTQP